MNERLRKLRKALDLTQQELADKIGIKRNSYANYETGRNTPIDAILISICREFNVNEEWLRTGVGGMFVKIPEEDLYSKAAASILKDDDAFAIEALKLYYQMNPDAKKAVTDYILQLSDLIRAHQEEKE